MYPLLNQGIVVHRQPDAGYCYHPGAEAEALRVNRTAEEILELCDGTLSTTEIGRRLAVRHAEDPLRAARLVGSFLTEAAGRSIIALRGEPPGAHRPSGRVTGSYRCWAPLLASVELTTSCNLSCSHCYASAALGPGRYQPAATIVAGLDALAGAGTTVLMLTGGEPTMHPGFREILAEASRRMTTVRVASNLYAIPAVSFDAIIASGASVQTSVDGLAGTHDRIRGKSGSFDRTMAAVRRFADAGVTVTVSMTANRLNWREAEDVALLARAAGAVAFRLGLTFPKGRAAHAGLCLTPAEAERLRTTWSSAADRYATQGFSVNRLAAVDPDAPARRNGSCGAGYLLVHVLASGRIVPCPMLDLPLGDLYRQPFDDAFSGPVSRVFATAVSPGGPACHGCPLEIVCGGCHAAALSWGRAPGCRWRRTKIATMLRTSESAAS